MKSPKVGEIWTYITKSVQDNCYYCYTNKVEILYSYSLVSGSHIVGFHCMHCRGPKTPSEATKANFIARFKKWDPEKERDESFRNWRTEQIESISLTNSHKCNCNTFDLVNFGCQCGGI